MNAESIAAVLERIAKRDDLPEDVSKRLDELRDSAAYLERSQSMGRLVEAPSGVADVSDLDLEAESSSTDYESDSGDESAGVVETLATSRATVDDEFTDPVEPSDELGLPDEYEYVDFAATGGMGEIHLVRERALNRVCAMKVIRRDRAEETGDILRFAREAQITAQISHHAVPAVYDFGRLSDGRLYFTMKIVGEWSLREVVDRVHRDFDGDIVEPQWRGWSIRTVVESFMRICEALENAHRCGVVHRDLKPDNMMVGRFGEAMVIDWGLARLVDNVEHTASGRGRPRAGATERRARGRARGFGHRDCPLNGARTGPRRARDHRIAYRRLCARGRSLRDPDR
ncbi:MAG: serine/threonine-protein kinase [Bradymonadaceae bacterium]